MKKMIQKSWYLSPILFNARQNFLTENQIKSLYALSKEIGVSINTLQKLKREEIISIESVTKIIDWSDQKRGKTPLSELLKRNAEDMNII